MKYESNWYHNQDAQTNSWLKRMYGIDLKRFDEMMEEQHFQCKLCKTNITGGDHNNKRVAVVDHCHDTGEVRALLCGTCNKLEGHLKTIRELGLLDAMIEHQDRTY